MIKKSIKNIAARILKDEKARGVFDIVFVNDKTIRSLNKKYRKIDRATDVLSFCMDEPDLLGDVIICTEMAKKNAKRYNVTFDEELKRLVVHGLLHLLGYDHKNKFERNVMRIKEEKYIGL